MSRKQRPRRRKQDKAVRPAPAPGADIKDEPPAEDDRPGDEPGDDPYPRVGTGW